MKLYNTLTRNIEIFSSNEPGVVKMYTCGPTVYNYAHIGNMRNYIGHDILDKTLRYIGYKVVRCMNITDVGHLTSDSDSGEDKMLKAAKKENKTSMQIAEFYTNAFFEDYKALNCRVPEIVSKATDNIDMYIKIINKLLKKGYAYQSGGNVYFDTSKLDDYYVLTNHKEDEMVVGARESVEMDENKKNQADFVLWFTTSKFENHELKWDSPFGEGYPGWHIECSGISIKYLGEHLDIHGGGIDNIFPHHTNEIAQSESYLGHKWCNYWFHNEYLIDETGKMSKSKGDFLTVSRLKEQGYNPLAFRFMCLNSHYRKQLEFSYDSLKQNEDILKKLKNKISLIINSEEFEEPNLNTALIDEYINKFTESLENDLNTANVITYLYEILKDDRLNNSSKLYLIKEYDKVLSLDLLIVDKNEHELTEEMEELIKKRNEYKANKEYEKADKIRNKLLKMGIELKDTRDGVEVIWI